MIEQSLFSLASTPDPDLERTGGMQVAVDETFSTAVRIRLDETSWVDHVQGWLAGDAELMDALMKQASWDQRSRWMYTRMVTEPRLTAEYPVIADAPQPVLHYLTDVLSEHYQRPYARLWMNWYRDNADGTGWHADRPANKQDEAVIPVLSLGATRRFLIRPAGRRAEHDHRDPQRGPRGHGRPLPEGLPALGAQAEAVRRSPAEP